MTLGSETMLNYTAQRARWTSILSLLPWTLFLQHNEERSSDVYMHCEVYDERWALDLGNTRFVWETESIPGPNFILAFFPKTIRYGTSLKWKPRTKASSASACQTYKCEPHGKLASKRQSRNTPFLSYPLPKLITREDFPQVPLTHKEGTAHIPHNSDLPPYHLFPSCWCSSLWSGMWYPHFYLFREVSQPKVVEAAGLTMEQGLYLGNLV